MPEEEGLREHPHVVGMDQIAGRLAVKPDTVNKWRTRGLLPDPTYIVGRRPAWDWRVIRRWAEKGGYGTLTDD